MEKVTGFLKRERVMLIIVCLAAVLTIVTKSQGGVISYPDMKILAIMWAFMIETGGLANLGLFDMAGVELVKKKNLLRESIILIIASLLIAMIATDFAAVTVVTLITFSLFKNADSQTSDVFLAKVLVLETVAAMVGGMLTPMGSLVNITLYEASGIDTGNFIKTMLPYVLIGTIVTVIVTKVMIGMKKNKNSAVSGKKAVSQGFFSLTLTELFAKSSTKFHSILIMYLMLMVVTVLTTLGHLPFEIMLFIVVILTLLADKKGLTRADYPMLISVAGLYVIAGRFVKLLLMYNGALIFKEQYEIVTVIMSQLLGNLPVASGIIKSVDSVSDIIVVSNICNFGMVSASMAGILSCRIIKKRMPKILRPFLKYYILINAVILAILMVVSLTR